MSDRYTEVETISWGSRLGGSCFGLLLGIFLFLASFFLLYWNEGRVNLSAVASTATEISATSPNTVDRGKLISTTGILASNELLTDNLFLKPGKYIAIDRDVEMFAWVESSQTETTKNLGGSETKTTTYTYNRDWVDNPKSSNSFKVPEGHENPVKSIPNFSQRVTSAKVGIYSLDIAKIELPSLNKVQLSEGNITLKDGVTLANNYLYKGIGTLGNPQVGDLRIQYGVLPSGVNVTVFGKLDSDNRITPYIDKSNSQVYRIFSGTRDEAISTLKTEHKIWTWVFRISGFLMMWIGLSLGLQPISVFLDFIPLLGNITEGLVGGSTFLVAFVLSAITILISMLLHNIVALAIAIVVALAVVIALRKKTKS